MSGPPGRGLQTSAGISPVIAPLVEENIPSRGSVAPNSAQPKHRYERFLLADDYRRRLPSIISRFTGYRSPGSEPPYDPLPFPPFSWLVYIPLKVEVWIFAWIGAFGGVLLIEAIMSTTTVFRDAYHSPIIITSFGASAVLVFGVIESPLAQPRNFVIGQFLSALVGTAITRLFILNRSYQGYLDNTAFHGDTFINGALSMATSLLAMLILSDVHPPAGATALNAAVEAEVVALSWRYLPVVLVSALIMLAWALLINNLGRRRYPIYWWKPEQCFVTKLIPEPLNAEEKALRSLQDDPLREAEDGGRTAEALLDVRIEGEGDGVEHNGHAPARTFEVGIEEPASRQMSPGDRRRAEYV